MLKLNGKPFSLRAVPPTALKVLAIVKKLPNDELLDAFELAKRIGVSPASLKLLLHEDILPHRAVIQVSSHRAVVFGNASTIAHLKKSMESA